MRTRMFWALALLLLAGGPRSTLALDVSESVTRSNVGGPPCYVWGGTAWKRCTGHAGSQDVYATNPSVVNYVSQAIGPTSFRENNGGGPWVATYGRDSSAAIPTNGGTRVGLWLNAIPDTNVVARNVLYWFAVGVRMCLTSAVDTTSAAPNLLLQNVGSGNGTLSNHTVAGNWQDMTIPSDSTTVGQFAFSSANLLPGEFLMPIKFAGAADPQGGSRYVELTFSQQTFGPQYVEFTLRLMGHWKLNPQATYIQSPVNKVKARLDVLVLK